MACRSRPPRALRAPALGSPLAANRSPRTEPRELMTCNCMHVHFNCKSAAKGGKWVRRCGTNSPDDAYVDGGVVLGPTDRRCRSTPAGTGALWTGARQRIAVSRSCQRLPVSSDLRKCRRFRFWAKRVGGLGGARKLVQLARAVRLSRRLPRIQRPRFAAALCPGLTCAPSGRKPIGPSGHRDAIQRSSRPEGAFT